MLKSAGAVLIAEGLNMAIFQQFWFVDNNILKREEFRDGTMFTPIAVNIVSDGFSVLIMNDRIQMEITSRFDESSSTVERVLGGIAKQLPQTPFRALGINFNHLLEFEPTVDFAGATRELFMTQQNPIAKYFTNADVQCGFYSSMNFETGRLKLDIKPVQDMMDGAKQKLLLNFNFHKDLTARDELEPHMRTWMRSLGLSEEISASVSSANKV